AEPIWYEGLSSEDRALLDPGPNEIDRTPDVLIVGGGAVGLAAAVMCSCAGLGRVQLIERDRLASGPSGSAAGGLSPGVHSLSAVPEFVALAREGLALHRMLDAEWGAAVGVERREWILASDAPVSGGTLVAPDVETVDADGA